MEIINYRPFSAEGKELTWAQVAAAMVGAVDSEDAIADTDMQAFRREGGQWVFVNLGPKALISEAFPDDYVIARELGRRAALINRALDMATPEEECRSLQMVLGGWHLELQRVGPDEDPGTLVYLEGTQVKLWEVSQVLTGTMGESSLGLFSRGTDEGFYRGEAVYSIKFSEPLPSTLPLPRYAEVLRKRYDEALAVLRVDRPRAVVPGS